MCSFSSFQYNTQQASFFSFYSLTQRSWGGGGTQQNVATATVFNETLIVGFIIMVVLFSEKKGTKTTKASNISN